MSFDLALRFTEILLALAFVQQSIEHLQAGKDERILFSLRIILSLCLLFGFHTKWICLALVILSVFILKIFQGPYNGGSDRMSLLILCCLTLADFLPTAYEKEVVFGYLALQLILSYFIAGFVKIINPEWRRGRALQDVFFFSAYPASESLRGWANRPRLLCLISWAIMIFELSFPLTLVSQMTLIAGLIIAAAFHLANACLFGLNRFFWIWLASYPSIVWLQERIFG